MLSDQWNFTYLYATFFEIWRKNAIESIFKTTKEKLSVFIISNKNEKYFISNITIQSRKHIFFVHLSKSKKNKLRNLSS